MLFLFESVLSRTWHDFCSQRFQAIPFLSLQMHTQFQQKEESAKGCMDEDLSKDSWKGNVK